MAQIITQNGGGGGGGSGSGDMLKSVYDTTNIEKDAFDYDNFYNTPDLSLYQTTSNLVTDLTSADDTHYPSALAVANAISSSGGGDVTGPASSTDGDVVLFNGATGKIIKDSGVALSSKLDASALSDTAYGVGWNGDTTHTATKNAVYNKISAMDTTIGSKADDSDVVKLSGNQTIAGTKTFSTSPVVPSKTTTATSSGTAIATEAQVKTVADSVATINGMISSNASSSNKLMDKNYIDDSINSVTAYYITKNAAGDQFTTYAELAAATTFYSGGVVRVPTRNDYTIVLDDENHDHATTRYIYNSGWEYQYTVNETALTQAQLDALNSGITAAKVSTYDGYASTISGKQDALSTQTAYTSKGTSTKVPTITTNTLGQVTSISETSIAFPVTSVNGSTGAVTVNDVKVATYADAPSTPTEGMVWYDTTNNLLKSYNGSARKPCVDTISSGLISKEGGKVNLRSINGTTLIYNPDLGESGNISISEFTPGGTATTGYVVTKTADSYEWAAPSGGIKLAPNSEYDIAYQWYGRQSTFENDLTQYYTDNANDTAFFTIED